jgi:hypothetical protein
VPSSPEYIGDMPHTWVGAEFATAIRRMLLRENGGTLELFRAVPESWWDGEGIRLNELPTIFGTTNLSARRDQSQATIELALTGPARNESPSDIQAPSKLRRTVGLAISTEM